MKKGISILLTLALLASLCTGALAAESTETSEAAYEVVLPIEYGYISAYSEARGVFVCADSKVQLRTLDGEILLDGYSGIDLYDDWIYTEKDGEFALLNYNLETVIAPAKQHIHLITDTLALVVTYESSDRYMNYYGPRSLYDLTTGEVVMTYESGDEYAEITLPDGTSGTPSELSTEDTIAVGDLPITSSAFGSNGYTTIATTAGEVIATVEDENPRLFRNGCYSVQSASYGAEYWDVTYSYTLYNINGEEIIPAGVFDDFRDSCEDSQCIVVAKDGKYGVIRLLESATAAKEEQISTFSDVAASAWYTPAVEAAVEAGILKGRGNNQFAPTGTVTGAEAITVALRLAGIDAEQGTGGDWYAPLVEAAREAGLLESLAGGESVTDYNAPVTRLQMAELFYCALKGQNYEVVTDTLSVEDLTTVDGVDYSSCVLPLYCWGILTGDTNGNFNQSFSLTRAELAQIIYRVIDPVQRQAAAASTWDRIGNRLTLPEGDGLQSSGVRICSCLADDQQTLSDALGEFKMWLDLPNEAETYLTDTLWLIDRDANGCIVLYFIYSDENGQMMQKALRYDPQTKTLDDEINTEAAQPLDTGTVWLCGALNEEEQTLCTENLAEMQALLSDASEKAILRMETAGSSVTLYQIAQAEDGNFYADCVELKGGEITQGASGYWPSQWYHVLS